jgi:hypothetical protein
MNKVFLKSKILIHKRGRMITRSSSEGTPTTNPKELKKLRELRSATILKKEEEGVLVYAIQYKEQSGKIIISHFFSGIRAVRKFKGYYDHLDSASKALFDELKIASRTPPATPATSPRAAAPIPLQPRAVTPSQYSMDTLFNTRSSSLPTTSSFSSRRVVVPDDQQECFLRMRKTS